MDPTTVFCPNLACPARGHIGQGHIGIHARQDKRFLCTVCRKTGCWLRRWDYSRPLASEPDVKVSLHPAQAWNNAPGCVCDTALTGRGFDTVRPLA